MAMRVMRTVAGAYEAAALAVDGWWQRLFGLPESVLTAAPAGVMEADAAQVRMANQAERLSNTRAALKVTDDAGRPSSDDGAKAHAEFLLCCQLISQAMQQGSFVLSPIGSGAAMVAVPRVGLNGKPTAMSGALYSTAHTMREQADDLYAYLLANAPGELADFIDNTARNFELQRERLRQSNVQNVLTGGGQFKAMVARDFYAMLAVLGLIDVMDRQKQKGGA